MIPNCDTEVALVVPVPRAKRMLGDIGNTKLFAMCRSGELERIKIGRRTMITVDSINAFISKVLSEGGL